MIPKAIVFDFDGVLTIGGEDLKSEAWNILAGPWSESARTALTESRERFSDGSGSRFSILHSAFEAIKVENPKMLTTAYAEAYNRLVQEMLLASGMPEGAKDTLDVLMRGCPLYINSATPEDAVRESTIALGISNYFSGLFGQPKTKIENLNRARNGEKCAPSEMVFIGDGKGDRRAAEEFHCQFIGIANIHNGWRLGEEPFPVVHHLRDVPAVIASL